MQEPATPSTKRSPRYAAIFLVLIALTLIELWVATAGLAGGWLSLILLSLAFGKAALVAAYYMHLHGDSRLYTTIFVLPVLLLVVFVLLSVVI
ncbi:MAG TPA: cytochrome C oxidase subunit IV family protein [Anaerolineales bacterium]|nr:cytochrome C oxidase subunit IV family protein [Anaerolineales bacterium]